MLHTVNQFLKFHSEKLVDCYKIWNSKNYAIVHRASFFSEIAENHRVKAEVLIEFLKHFKFDVDVIQKLGAATDSEKKQLFDESFLNLLQRFDIEKSIKFSFPTGHTTGNPIFLAKGGILYLSIIEVLIQSYWSDVTLKLEEQ